MADLTETELATMLRAEQETNLLLQESLADLELAAEDRGWSRLSAEDNDFTDTGRRKIADTSALARLANPLIKRGMQLRVAYIWGQGVTVSVPDADAGTAQDVNGIVQAFLDHPSNRDTFTGAGAHEDNENQLGTDGEIFFCLPTNPLTGEVIVRLIEPDEITEILTDPEDSTRHRYYKRQYVARAITARGERSAPEQVTVFYPAHDYNPRGIDRLNLIDGCPVKWHEPVRAFIINKPKRRSMRGLGDIYPALAWAKSSKEVLEAWVLLFKALTRYAYQMRTKSDKAQRAAAQLRTAQTQPVPPGNPQNAGATFVGGNETSLEAVSKTGAQIDANAARPVIMMVAAAFGVPITMLLGDPGVTGARAVAATLDQPMELVMRMRRDQWSEVYTDICTYVVNWAVKAGKLRGTVAFVGDREVVTLAGGQDRTVKIDWPDFDSTPVKDRVEAVRIADETGKLPPEVTLAQLLSALKVDNADEIWDANTDDEGKFIPLDVVANQARDQFALRGGATGTTDPVEDEPEDSSP